ncbi:MAG: bifunctional phosphoribosylaminoimidazolecarboxamide formyltransferase/IMP cyclohydrolase [Calditrichia bacterium]
MSGEIVIKRALISCWDKTGIVDLAKSLHQMGVEIVSSGGTAGLLTEAGIPVVKVEEITGFPEILDGRVKTLHPKIHGGILARRTPEHLQQLQQHGIQPFDLVVLNLYPFLDNLQNGEKSLQEMVELIDIGGPAMLRASAKNFESVTVIHRPEQYAELIEHLKENNGATTPELRQKWAKEAFFYTAYYDSQIGEYLQGLEKGEALPERLMFYLQKSADLRYGENPHQKAALYNFRPGAEAPFKVLGGKPMSFNNYVDAAAAYNLVAEFSEPVVAIIKHTNPCGIATGKNWADAFDRALAGDPISAFGGIIAVNGVVDETLAGKITSSFYECVIAPGFTAEAVAELKKKKNLRVLEVAKNFAEVQAQYDLKLTPFGGLVQENDLLDWDEASLKSVGGRETTDEEFRDLRFAWRIVKHVKSNAIVFVKNGQLLAAGAGQMSRVDSVKLAKMKADHFGHDLKGAVMASDAFFPFRDGLDAAAECGITAVVQPGGSIRDEEVIQAAREHRMAMILTGIRHFKH